MELVAEAKLHELLGPSTAGRLEASGVVARDGHFYVVFHSSSEIAAVDGQLALQAGRNRLVSQGAGRGIGYEDISPRLEGGGRIQVFREALSPSSWELVSEGTTYRFPRDRQNRPVYCNVEGVSWIAPDRVVVVSDKAKPSVQRKGCRIKDQSIHVFDIPAAPPGRADGALA